MSDELKAEYDVLRTKWALIRTFLLFCVSLKALIMFSTSKHLKKVLYFALLLIGFLVTQYIYTMQMLNNKEYIENPIFDYYPLMLIPIILYLMYISWRKRASF